MSWFEMYGFRAPPDMTGQHKVCGSAFPHFAIGAAPGESTENADLLSFYKKNWSLTCLLHENAWKMQKFLYSSQTAVVLNGHRKRKCAQRSAKQRKITQAKVPQERKRAQRRKER